MNFDWNLVQWYSVLCIKDVNGNADQQASVGGYSPQKSVIPPKKVVSCFCIVR